jgi:hypothetical protein
VAVEIIDFFVVEDGVNRSVFVSLFEFAKQLKLHIKILEMEGTKPSYRLPIFITGNT